jgi:hypothetical protein
MRMDSWRDVVKDLYELLRDGCMGNPPAAAADAL